VVRGALQISDLRDGFNTLTVVVVNGSARARITESVVFFAADQARVRPPADVPGRPVIPAAGYIDPNLLAPALRQLAGARTARRALTGPPPPGAKRIAFSSLYPASSKEARHEAAAALVSRLSEQTRMAGLLREKLRMLETGESA
jgi:hypothetical protein